MKHIFRSNKYRMLIEDEVEIKKSSFHENFYHSLPFHRQFPVHHLICLDSFFFPFHQTKRLPFSTDQNDDKKREEPKVDHSTGNWNKIVFPFQLLFHHSLTILKDSRNKQWEKNIKTKVVTKYQN